MFRGKGRKEGERNSAECPADHGVGTGGDHLDDHDISHSRGGRVPFDAGGRGNGCRQPHRKQCKTGGEAVRDAPEGGGHSGRCRRRNCSISSTSSAAGGRSLAAAGGGSSSSRSLASSFLM